MRLLHDGITRQAIQHTTHCLIGCGIGEITGMFIAAALGWPRIGRLSLAIVLAFAFGYYLTYRGVRKHAKTTGEAIKITAATDTVSIATMEAVDTVRALIVPYDRFSSFLDAHPGAARAYRHAVTRRWSDTATVLRNFSLSSGTQRVAKLLLDLATQYGSANDGEIDIDLTQEELAGLAGTSRATVTRAFSNWRGRGFIRTGQRRITITNPEGLKRIVGRLM